MTTSAPALPAPTDAKPPRASGGRVLGQGVILIAGFAAAHGLSLVRNACVGYALSRGDFGTAASITLVLQMIEVLSDLGPDRLLLQAEAHEQHRLLEAAHALTILRGAVLALLMLAGAEPASRFFGVPQAWDAFALAALVPFVRGFSHLGFRLAQRRLDNTHYMTIEVVSQTASLAVAWPLLQWRPEPNTVVALILLQAVVATAVSHVLAQGRYRVRIAGLDVGRIIRFGWPIWLSALPLLAVSHVDRLVIGRYYGMEALAGFTAATMLAMIPSLIVSRLAGSLLIPMVADRRQSPGALRLVVRQASELAVIVAGCYAVALTLCGGPLIALVFGPRYYGLEHIVAWLAAMFAVRMVQAVPGMALMADGSTQPLLWASLVRAAVLPLVVVAAVTAMPVEMIAAIGLVGELASLAQINAALDRHRRGLGRDCALRSSYLVMLVVLLLVAPLPRLGLALAAPLALAGVAVTALGLLSIMPSLRRALEARLERRPAAAA